MLTRLWPLVPCAVDGQGGAGRAQAAAELGPTLPGRAGQVEELRAFAQLARHPRGTIDKRVPVDNTEEPTLSANGPLKIRFGVDLWSPHT